ncbi:MAG: kynureninase [Burkholderiaceae bacterium]|nr:kynureninase [Burkholderiaceae bacterium]
MKNAVQSGAPPAVRAREQCAELDARDELASARELFSLPPGVIYLDGNSLGAMPCATAARVKDAIERQWGEKLITSWNDAGWVDLPQRLGAKIAALVGAADDEVVVADSTSVNLFKLLSGALAQRPERKVILSERGNFPTDLYIAQGLARQLGGQHELRLVERHDLAASLTSDIAVLLATQVDYRTGSRLDLASLTAAAHAAGALTIWDLAHSAGAFRVELDAAQADFAVGCGYKYLNGGPGAPAFLFVARRHQQDFAQPLSGWFGHEQPFLFEPDYRPAPGIARALCGSPPILSMVALEAGVDTMREALGGDSMALLEAKAAALTACFIDLVAPLAEEYQLELVTPRDPAARGNQVSYACADGERAYALTQALIARGVIGDFRTPNIARFGFAPLYLRFVDVWDAVEHLRVVLARHEWDNARFRARRAVT